MATSSRLKTGRPLSASPNPLRRSTGNLATNSSGMRPKLATSSSRRLAASFDTGHTRKSLTASVDLGKVESEYIRNLQQQVYFLELESNYLREQLKKATVMPPRVTEEADRMMRKLKALQEEIDAKAHEVMRKESQMRMMESDRETAIQKLRNLEESFALEKQELVSEVVRLKKQVERQDLDTSRREVHFQEIRKEADQGLTALQDAENRINLLKSQLEEKTDQYNRLRVEFEEKRAECLKVQTELQELEERFFRSDAKSKEEIGRELRDEIKHLRYDLRQKEISSEQDRALRNKISDDCAALVKENAALSSQVLELQKHLDLERQFKDDKETRRQANIQELVTLKESEKQLQRELNHYKEQLRIEQQKYRNVTEKLVEERLGKLKFSLLNETLSEEEKDLTRSKLRGSRLQSELLEIEGINSSQKEENIQLRRDKVLLTDQVVDLQAKLDEQQDEVEKVRLDMEDLRARNAELESKIRLQKSMDSIKWEEFERMADSLKEFSRSMTPHRSARTIEFDT